MKIYKNLEQGSDEWLEARRGLLTASEVKLAVTPTCKVANNDKTRAHAYELAAQRITGQLEPQFISDDMLRGMYDETTARELYEKHKKAKVKEVGFITNDKWDCTIGYSPDGLVGKEGIIEIKSRRQKFQFEAIATNQVPKEHMAQIQAGLLVSEREWCDYVQYCAGMPLFIKRIEPDAQYQKIIIEAAQSFEKNIRQLIKSYEQNAKRFLKTEVKNDEGVELL